MITDSNHEKATPNSPETALALVKSLFPDEGVEKLVTNLPADRSTWTEDMQDSYEGKKYSYNADRNILADKISTISPEKQAEFLGNLVKYTDTASAGTTTLSVLSENFDISRGDSNLLQTMQDLANRWLVQFPDSKSRQTEYPFQKPIAALGVMINSISRSGIEPSRPHASVQEIEMTYSFYSQLQQKEDSLSKEEDKQKYRSLRHAFRPLDEKQLNATLQAWDLIKDGLLDLDPIIVNKVYAYLKGNSLTSEERQRIIPFLQSSLKAAEKVLKSGNIWASKSDSYGIGDFITTSEISNPNPENISTLLLAYKQIPTNNFSSLEQNRSDAYIIAIPGSPTQRMGGFRDFVHDQRPGVHEVVSALVEYSETKDPKVFDRLTGPAYRYFRDNGVVGQQFLEIDFQALCGETKPERVIDILKRLQANTAKQFEKPVQTGMVEIDEKLARVDNLSPSTDTNLQALGEATQTMVAYFKSKQQEGCGVPENIIGATLWLDYQCARALQNMSYEQQQGAYKSTWFADILRFSSQTSGTSQDQESTEILLQTIFSKSPEDAYRAIGQWKLKQLEELCNHFKKIGKTSLIEMVWSGNLAHELIGLFDQKEASTAYGKKHRNEKDQEHPGD